MKTIILTLVLLLCGAWSARADITTATVDVGGPESFGSNGSFDPGTLDDGVTVATATYTFTLDSELNLLTLVVDNTSPVIEGVDNPLLTRIYFNMPVLVEDAVLIDQDAGCDGVEGCTEPTFDFHFDPDLLDGNNPLKASPFGSFSALLQTQEGINGGIANPFADELPGEEGSQVIGPVTFVLALTGDLSAFTADFFAKSFSKALPGDTSVNCAGKFQGGGEPEVGGTISDSSLDSGDPLFFIQGEGIPGTKLRVVLNGDPGFVACMFYSFDEGTTEFPRFGITLNMANPKELFAFDFKQDSLLELEIMVPDLPAGLAGTTVIAEFVEVDSANMDEGSFVVSNTNRLTIL